MTDDEISALDLDGWPMVDDYLIELGRVTLLWTNLEMLLNLCIAKLAGFNDGSDPTPFILVTHSSFPQRLDMLSTLCELHSSKHPNLKEYKATVATLKIAQTARNKFAHNSVGMDERTGDILMALGSARGRLKTSVEKITCTDIRKAIIAVFDAQRSLYKLIFQRNVPTISEVSRMQNK